MNTATEQRVTKQMTRVEMAEHRFKQTRILAMATRLDLVVSYYRHSWEFIEPLSKKAWTGPLNDDAAVAWLEAIPFPRKAGTLEQY